MNENRAIGDLPVHVYILAVELLPAQITGAEKIRRGASGGVPESRRRYMQNGSAAAALCLYSERGPIVALSADLRRVGVHLRIGLVRTMASHYGVFLQTLHLHFLRISPVFR